MATPGKESENGVYEFPYMRPQNNRTKWENIRRTIWDPSTHKFLGRTAKNWGQVFIFYSIFYMVLTVLFVLCMEGLFSTLNETSPKWLLDKSLIGTNPGMGFRPISNRTEEGSLIWYDSKNETSIRKWIDLTDDFLELYLDGSKLPGGGRNQEVCDFDRKPKIGNVCEVDVSKWGPCSREKNYGYNNFSPCFFLKLNRIFGWEAEYYNDTKNLPEDMPNDLKEHINTRPKNESNHIWVSCKGENPADRETIGELSYYPARGFSSSYYPYTNVLGYLSPLVAVHVERPQKNVLINIECRAWAKNIIYRGGNQQREGSVHLELMID